MAELSNPDDLPATALANYRPAVGVPLTRAEAVELAMVTLLRELVLEQHREPPVPYRHPRREPYDGELMPHPMCWDEWLTWPERYHVLPGRCPV